MEKEFYILIRLIEACRKNTFMDKLLPFSFMERWLSGRRHVPAKDAYLLTGTVGSNPTLSVVSRHPIETFLFGAHLVRFTKILSPPEF